MPNPDPVFKLNRQQITEWAKSPQVVRFIENLQSNVSTLPDDLITIYLAIQDSSIIAENALSAAMQAQEIAQSIEAEATLFPIHKSDEENQENDFKQQLNYQNGWAKYSDSTYTSGAPFTIATTVTSTLPNNSGTILSTYLPDDCSDLYLTSSSKIIGQKEGDVYLISIRFSAKAATGTSNWFDCYVDIGGTPYFLSTHEMPKGAGVEQYFSISKTIECSASLVSSGGTIKITAGASNIDIYSIEYVITRINL